MFVCITACMFWSSAAFGEGGPKPKPLPKAKTIAELAARYDSSKCLECHEDVHDDWSESLHSKSILGTPRTAPTILTAIDKGLELFPYSGVKKDSDITVESLMMCMKCHLPQIDEATDDVAREIVGTIRGWLQAHKDGETEKAEKLEKMRVFSRVFARRGSLTSARPSHPVAAFKTRRPAALASPAPCRV